MPGGDVEARHEHQGDLAGVDHAVGVRRRDVGDRAGFPLRRNVLALQGHHLQHAFALHTVVDLRLVVALMEMPLGHVVFTAHRAGVYERGAQRHVRIAGDERKIADLVYQAVAGLDDLLHRLPVGKHKRQVAQFALLHLGTGGEDAGGFIELDADGLVVDGDFLHGGCSPGYKQ